MSRLAPPWLAEPATQLVLGALAAAAIEARFVGGCVRDALLGLAGGDIDIATPAPPETVIAALRAARIKALPTGLAHGTVTALVASAGKSLGPPQRFEITTLRRDVETDGRHARVAFDAGWEEDASRRDFTINAIYLSPDGALSDPVGGAADLAAHRVRFVGDPATRIAEDVLRLLRYYRFEARFGAGSGDAAARAACRAAAPALATLSAERVSQELMRLLSLAEPTRTLAMMRDDGVIAAIIPEVTRLDRLGRLLAIAPKADPIVRLAALIDSDRAGAAALAARLRLSVAARKRLAGLAAPWPPPGDGGDRSERLALYRLGTERYRDLALLYAAATMITPERLQAMLARAAAWRAPTLPIGGDDVTALGVPPGPRVGRLLAAVQAWWEEGDFAADRAQCLDRLAALVVGAAPLLPP